MTKEQLEQLVQEAKNLHDAIKADIKKSFQARLDRLQENNAPTEMIAEARENYNYINTNL